MKITKILLMVAPLLIGGCVLSPAGTKEEQDRAAEAGRHYEREVEKRAVPELPERAGWQDVLHRAFLSNGELEAAYFEWKAALARIPQVANYPNSNIAPSFSYMFSSERMKSFDRTTVTVGFDPMENLAFPTKVAQAGKVALAEARAAGKRFEAMKFEIQRKVLVAYLELALHEEQIRIQRDNVNLLRLVMESAGDRVGAGGAPQDLLRAQTQYRLAENQLATMESEHAAMRAMLNGMLNRTARAPIGVGELPEPRKVGADDAMLIAVATDNNPELARLAREVEGRSDALELARMAYIPDINPMAGFTGSISQMIGAMVVLPTTIPEIKGKIEEERAMLRAAQAMLRQTRSDRAAGFVAALVAMRNAQRQAEVFTQAILPRAEQTLAGMRQSYAAGAASFTDLIESQRMLLEVRLMIAEARIEREKRLAEMEALAGVDIETLGGGASTRPTTRPATRPAEVH